MTTEPREKSLFITAEYALREGGGGVQRCTREYLATLAAAGIDVHTAAYAIDRSMAARFRRKVRPRPYADLVPPRFVRDVAGRLERQRPAWVFFNQIEAAPLAARLSQFRGGQTRFVMLSHGVDSSDYLHTTRIFAPKPAAAAATWLGRQLLAERAAHAHFDAIFCLSETDRLFHEWLGGTGVTVLPRVIAPDPLAWAPQPGRIGTIGTLDHAPNYEGVALLAQALAARRSPLTLRLIGRPEARGQELAGRFANINYLGGLTDAEFAAEARTWSVFANPIFCTPRGCSTKLAVPLSWRLPVASTRAGARGYWWDETLVPLAETPAELAALAESLANAPEARTGVTQLAERSPRLSDVAALLRRALAAAQTRRT